MIAKLDHGPLHQRGDSSLQSRDTYPRWLPLFGPREEDRDQIPCAPPPERTSCCHLPNDCSTTPQLREIIKMRWEPEQVFSQKPEEWHQHLSHLETLTNTPDVGNMLWFLVGAHVLLLFFLKRPLPYCLAGSHGESKCAFILLPCVKHQWSLLIKFLLDRTELESRAITI